MTSISKNRAIRFYKQALSHSKTKDQIAKGLHRNKWYRIEEVILHAGKAPNAGIAGATARLGNAASVQKNDSKWSVYFWASPKAKNGLGWQFLLNNQYVQAKANLLEALEIRKRLAKDNPQRFEPEVAETQYNLGQMYFSMGDSEKALTHLNKSLLLYRKLEPQSPQVYTPEVARTLF